jgi:hypothetical protein
VFPGVIGRAEGLPHRQGHEEFLGELLLAEGDGAARHHDALPALVVALGDLLDDAGQPSQGESVLVLAGYHRAPELNHHPPGELELVALGEGGATRPVAGLQLPAQVHSVALYADPLDAEVWASVGLKKGRG